MSYRSIIVVIVLTMLPDLYAATPEQVQAEFNRCGQVMERAERSLQRYEDELALIKRDISRMVPGQQETRAQELQALESRLEYFHNRIERSRGQADKIRDDLKNISGPTCPSCVESSVNLYCRSGESLQTDIDEYLGKTADLRSRIGTKPDIDVKANNTVFKLQWASVDSLYRVLSMPDSCDDKAGLTLLTQAHINLVKADSLYASKETEKAEKMLGIARSLLDKAVQRCGVK